MGVYGADVAFKLSANVFKCTPLSISRYAGAAWWQAAQELWESLQRRMLQITTQHLQVILHYYCRRKTSSNTSNYSRYPQTQ